MIRRIYKIFVVCLLLTVILTGCDSGTQISNNSIQSMTLSDEQKKITDLLNAGNEEIQLYSFNTSTPYKQAEVWVEVYKDGQLINKNAVSLSFLPMDDTNTNGELALIINRTPDYQWSFIEKNGKGMGASTTSELCTYYGNSASISSPMSQPVAIEDSKEIILYTKLFSNPNDKTDAIGSEQDFIKNPELLKKYSFAHIVKCKFEK